MTQRTRRPVLKSTRNPWYFAVMPRIALPLLVAALSASLVFAQTEIKLPKNKYTPEQDVKLGREAAAEVRKEYPVISDARIAKYLSSLGDRLVTAAPAALKQPVYEYSFTPVNLKEINAFALPGGPMFVNRGMFDAAASEGEVIGVMAHELSHVLLRHGTANMAIPSRCGRHRSCRRPTPAPGRCRSRLVSRACRMSSVTSGSSQTR